MSDSRENSPTTRPPTVVLVGHCGPDSWMLKSAVGRALPGASVTFSNTDASTKAAAESADLLLVNRVLDGEFEDDSGIALIAALRDAKGRKAEMMLVSNFADAQSQAEAAGAVPGFGKSNAGTIQTADRLRAAVARAGTQA